MNDLTYITSVFFTLLFIVDPLGLIPVFIYYLQDYTKKQKKFVIIKATLISISISIFFIIFGKQLLKILGISPGSFLIAGGILLFMISIEMLFGRQSQIKTGNEDDKKDIQDISVFPLSIPLLCGPGNIAALIMFSSQPPENITKYLLLIIISAVVFIIAFVIMFFSDRIGIILGKTGISISQRLTGLILSAMSIQFIKNGLQVMELIK